MLSALVLALLAPAAQAQVTATAPNGVTNPSAPFFAPVGSYVNQTSMARLVSLNGVDDFCLYGPPEAGPQNTIGSTEPIVVAYCTKPRNNARIIPDGTIKSAHFVRTPLYVQIHGFLDGTRINIPEGDSGGELDPWGPEAVGNPIGGNVTTYIPTGQDVFYMQWMSFMSYDQYCMRICTAENSTHTAELTCEHELDIMGCAFVMAIEDFYNPANATTFTSCDGDVAAPPGLYPQPGGGYSTFRQRYTGSYTNAGTVGYWTVGQTVTPSAPAYYPATSNCYTYPTISNGVNTQNFLVASAPSTLVSGSTRAVTGIPSTSQSRPAGLPTGSAGSSASSGSGSASSRSGTSTTTARPSGATNAAVASTAAASPVAALIMPGMGVVGAVLGSMLVGAVAIFA